MPEDPQDPTAHRAPALFCVRPQGGGLELCHPLALRALQELTAAGLGPDARVHASVTVQHVLECQADIDRFFAQRSESSPTLVVELRGPLSFSGAELARVAPRVSPAQLESAVRFLLDASRRHAPHLVAEIAQGLVGLSPQTTRVDLREHLDGLRRHGLQADPLASASHGGFAVQDRDAAAVVASVVGGATPRQRMDRLSEALDAAGGPARGARGRPLRLLPSRRSRDRHAPTIQEVVLSRPGDPRPERQRAIDAIVDVRAAARLGARSLVLSGQDAPLAWYLEDLAALARSLGFEQVIVDARAEDLRGRARALAKAGVTTVRVTVKLDAGLDDDRWLAGPRALLDAGVPVHLLVPLAPGRLAAFAEVVESLARTLPPSVAGVEKVVARVLPQLSLADATTALTLGAQAARLAGAPIEVAPGTELPPCVFDDLPAVAAVLRLSEGLALAGRDERGLAMQHTRVALCEGCGASHVCPGPLRARAAEVTAVGRRLAPAAPGLPPTEERRRVLQELRSVILRKGADGRAQERRVLRINFHCNQACDFCFVSRQLPAPEDALIEEELCDAARVGAALAISGGEPTLNPRLPRYIARARELGIEDLELQTNAVKMSDPAYAASLATAGLRLAFVSLHGTTAATSDRVTAAPGTFGKTLDGMRNLLREGVGVRVNFVVCGYNAGEFPELPDFIDRELRSVPGARVEVNFSFVAPSSNVPRDAALVPRFSDVAWALEAALSRAAALGLDLLGFDSQCGVPPCFLPERVRARAFAQDLPAQELAAFAGSFRKAPACERCSFTRRCYGVRSGYAEMYGTGELHAVRGG